MLILPPHGRKGFACCHLSLRFNQNKLFQSERIHLPFSVYFTAIRKRELFCALFLLWSLRCRINHSHVNELTMSSHSPLGFRYANLAKTNHDLCFKITCQQLLRWDLLIVSKWCKCNWTFRVSVAASITACRNHFVPFMITVRGVASRMRKPN